MGRAGVDGCAISVASLSTPYIGDVDEGENRRRRTAWMRQLLARSDRRGGVRGRARGDTPSTPSRP